MRNETPLFLVLLVWCGIALASSWSYQPVPIRPADVPPGEFSAARAEEFLERLYKNAEPHPAGNNSAFRSLLIREIENLGYRVEQHKTSSPTRNKRTELKDVPLVNLIFRLDGTSSKRPVMLTGHYDSTSAGPGAADDGSAVAVMLEIARTVRGMPPPERGIVFLLSDGEEMGLLGARRFVEEHPLADSIAAVINMEARGTTGPSIMFETSEDSSWLVELFARTSRRPFASSFFYEIYKFLPNDTDFTVFREHGISGFNFAFIGDVKNYHTPNDNFDTVDRRSIQHHGENALPLLLALASFDIENQTADQAVYFDLFGLVVVRWPAPISFGLAIAGLVLVSWSYCRPAKTEPVVRTHAIWSIVATGIGLFGTLVVFGFGFLLIQAYSLDTTLDNPFPAHPVPIQLSFWTYGLTIWLAIAWLSVRHMNWRPIWFGVWVVWAFLAIAASLKVTGASYLFIVPLLVTGIASLASIFWGDERNQAVFVSVVGAMGAAVIWVPMERLFYDAVGFSLNIALIIRVAIALSATLPLMMVTGRKTLAKLTVGSLLISVVLTVWAALAN